MSEKNEKLIEDKNIIQGALFLDAQEEKGLENKNELFEKIMEKVEKTNRDDKR